MVHDPCVQRWWEFEKQYPRPGYSWARFFRNQEKLKELRVQKDIATALQGADAAVLAAPSYLRLDPDEVVRMAGRPHAVVDCFSILDDARIRRYFKSAGAGEPSRADRSEPS